jgi:cell division protein FtsL
VKIRGRMARSFGRAKPEAPSRWIGVLFRPKAPANRRTNAAAASGPAPEEELEKGEAPRGADTIGAGYLALLCLVLCAVVFAFVYHLRVRFDGIELGYATSAARSRQSHLVLERQELRLELASLKSPARVEEEARERLGMEVPGHDRIVVIGEKRGAVPLSGGAL